MPEQASLWVRISDKPFLSPQPGTVAPEAVTTPDILIRGGQLQMFIGAVSTGFERLISFDLPVTSLQNGQVSLESASIILEAGPYDFDAKHVFDPAVIYWMGKYQLFYSAVGLGEDAIGLATSLDGRTFIKNPAPILTGRSPEVVIRDDIVYLYYVLRSLDGGYRIWVSRSSDGHEFNPVISQPVVSTGLSGEWDAFEVTTPRIFHLRDTYFMLYAGGDRPDRKDLPDRFGLARSKDLIHWEKFARNPVFACGKPGLWDDGAIWFGTVFEFDEVLYLLYEGGRQQDVTLPPPCLTQVGLASISVGSFLEAVSTW